MTQDSDSDVHISPVSQWCDTQSISTSQELILIDKVDVSDGDDTLISVLHKVEARLFQPLKVCRVSDVFAALKEEIVGEINSTAFCCLNNKGR